MDYFFRKLRTEYPPVADDLFERADIAESLTRIIGQSEQPTSILVDGDWGSGKSVFLKRLKAGFEERNWPCVVVDAFRLDYHSDAFTAVAGEVVKVARAKAGETPAFMALVSKGKSVAKVLVKAGIRVGSAGLIDEAGLSELGSEIVKQGSADLEEFASELIEGREKEERSFNGFREALENIRGELSEGNSRSSPLVILVDELDRCRPDFALDIIELTKHLFDVPGVSFVFAVNRRQFSSAISGRYGAGFDFDTYLQKFFEIEVNLQLRSSGLQTGDRQSYTEYLLKGCGWNYSADYRLDAVVGVISRLADAHSCSLRDIERVVTQFLFFVTGRDQLGNQEIGILAGLSFLRVVHPDEYKNILEGNLVGKEWSQFTVPPSQFESATSSQSLERLRDCWTAISLSRRDLYNSENESLIEGSYIMESLFGQNPQRGLVDFCRSMNFLPS